ncbi:hypothetical protein B0J11DRAFT_287720 [Dendryphion nanum]|uniref:Rhodopsin domain-containing protein n=1 Tax=Dendryphion nanum TaxID=256645 RepID=A0A9P9DW57_9PLEO|nr:hypothetical protein B0J11DRAFT_287720 [Dendryphion nanum]
MRYVPPEVLLSFPTPNYDDPVTRGHALLVVNSIFVALTVVVVCMRMYTRIYLKRWFGVDDVFILLALVFTLGLTAAVLLANRNFGWDRHIYDIPLTQIEPTLKIGMAAKVLFVAAASFTRLSLLSLYYRLVYNARIRGYIWAIHANTAFTVAIFIAFVFLAVFLCTPVKNYWMFGSPPNTCLDEGIATMFAGVTNCIADLACTVVPIPLVARLEMPFRQRVAIIFLFSLGFIVTIAGIVRTWFVYKALILEYDTTWYSYPLWIAAAVEIDIGVICASAPVLKPLLSKISLNLSAISSRLSSLRSGYGSRSGGLTSRSNGTRSDGGTTLQGTNATTSKTRPERRTEVTPNVEPNLNDIPIELNQWEDVERGRKHLSQAESCQANLGSNSENSSVEHGILDRGRPMSRISEDDHRTQIARVMTQSSDGISPISPSSPRGFNRFYAR